MSIQTKIIAVLVVVLGGLLLGNLAVLDQVVLESFRTLERQEIRREIGRTMASVDDEAKSLDSLATTWSEWDGLAKFANNDDPKFAQQFLSEQELAAFGLDLVIVIDRHRHATFRYTRNRETNSEISLRNLNSQTFPKDHLLLAHLRGGGNIRGTVASDQGPMLVAAAPLFGKNQHPAAVGTVIVGRLMNKAAVSRISGYMNNALEMTPITDVLSGGQQEMVNRILALDEPVIETGHDGAWTAFLVQRDLFGYPAALYSITAWSSIHNLGGATVRTAGTMGVIGSLVVLLAILFMMRRMIVRPFADMQRSLLAIRASGDMSRTLPLKGNDEFRIISGEINDLLMERTAFEQALERHQEELEKRVEERTYELQREIADREVAQETLKFAEFSLSHSSEFLLWLRRDQRILYVNEATCRHLGYSRDELLNMSYADFSDGPPPDKDWDLFWEELRHGEAVLFDTRHRRKDGSAVPVEVRATVMEYAGEEFLFAFAQDISRRIARERALVETERRFRTLTEEASQGIVVHRGFYPLYINPAFLRIFGFEGQNEFLRHGGLEATLAPEEMARIRGYDLARMQGRSAPNDYVYRGLRKDGSEVWLNNRSFMIDWGDGPAICTVLFDVTKSRKATQQLYLMETAVQEVNDPFFAVNSEGLLTYVNDAACRALDYTRDELLAMYVPQINHAQADEWPDFWDKIKALGHKVTFGSSRRKDGTTFPVEISSSFIDHEGQEYVFSFVRDISERVRAENDLREAHDELEKRVEERTQELTREVEERRRAEAALQQSENRLRGAVESLQEGFALYDADDRLVLMNARYANNHPHADEILAKGGTFEDIARAKVGLIADAKGREEEFVQERLRAHRNPGPPIIREFTDGRWFLLRESRTWEGGITLTSTDITELKKIEGDLKRKTELFDTAVRAMNNGIVVIDPDLRFAAFNDHYLKLFDFPPELVYVGAPLANAVRFLVERGEYEDVDAPDEEIVQRHLERVRSPDTTIARRRLKNGRTIESRRGHLPDGGVVSIHVDVTENAELEERLREARDTAESANQAKSVFLANMSHEIRTPMNGILGVAEMLRDTPLNNSQQGMLEIIQDSSRTLMGIIDDILDFSKIEAGRIELDPSPFRLTELIDGVAELMAPRAEEKRNRLNVFVDPALPDTIVSDPTRLRQILLNLVGNAVKFTDNGVVGIDVRPHEVDGNEPPRLVIRITDTGIGISPANQRKLFQPFEQGDSSTMRRFGGTGLGLSICKALTEVLGGDVDVDSKEGAGSTFSVTIPLHAEHDATVVMGRPFVGTRVGILAADHETGGCIESYMAHLGAETKIIPSLRALTQMTSGGALLSEKFDLLVVDHDRAAVGISRFLNERERSADPISQRTIVLMPRGHILAISADDVARRRLYVPKPIQRAMLWQAAAMALGLNLPGIDKPVRNAAETASLPLYAPPDFETARQAGALVLFAEDNPVNCKVICMMLERLGIAVETVASGSEAWNRLRRQPFGLLITDCHMPEMDGYELTERIRTLERSGNRPRLPIIALTADALIGTRERCKAAGMDDYLPKPVDRSELNALIQRWLPQAISLRRPVGESEANHDTPPPSFPAEAILDLRYIHDAVGGDETMVAPLLQDYLRNARQLVDDMLRAFESEDFARAREAAHAAKGTSLLAGAVRFANLCERIELCLRSGDTEKAADWSRRIEPELAIVSQAVAGHDRRSVS